MMTTLTACAPHHGDTARASREAVEFCTGAGDYR